MATPAELLDAAATGNLSRLKQIEGEYRDLEVFRRICNTFKDDAGWTALHRATEVGKTRICRYLVENVKVDMNMKSVEGDTPLLIAVMNEQLPVAEYLIRKGADVRLSNFRGIAPLHIAAAKGLKKLMLLLISQGAEIETHSNCGTPLQAAVARGRKKAVRILLDHNSDPNLASPLLSPVMLSISDQSLDCLDMLLKAGADPNRMSQGITPIAAAAIEYRNEFLKFLLKAGADPNIVGSRELKKKENFQLAKQRGATAFRRNDYLDAMC